MGGALLNLVATGTENVLLYEQPSFSYWRGTWKKFTNFGIQTFRLDYEGQPTLRDSQSSRIRFKVPRNGQLLTQTYVSIDLPDVYSCLPARTGPNGATIYLDGNRIPPDESSQLDPVTFQPYEFQWNEKLGFNCIERVEVMIGGHLIDEYTGEYLAMCQERDGDAKQNELLDEMIGNTTELTDPEKYANSVMAGTLTGAYDYAALNNDNIMLSKQSMSGIFQYSGTSAPGTGINGGYPVEFLRSLNFTRDIDNYALFASSSYPQSWPWRVPTGTLLASPEPWNAQFPLPNTADFSVYPNSKPESCPQENTPSIRGRQLIVPLNNWFGRNSKAALPLVALQYAEVEIFVTFRPLNEWFTVMKYMPPDGGFTAGGTYDTSQIQSGRAAWEATRCNPPSAASGYTSAQDNFPADENFWPVGMPQRVAPQYGGYYDYRSAYTAGLQLHKYNPTYYTPDPITLATFLSPLQNWDPNIHLIANYAMLEDDEASLFAQDEQTYLVRTTHDFTFYGVRSADSVDIETYGLIGAMTWRFRRSDVNLRNQWLNYTNWRFLSHPNILPMIVKNIGFLSRQQAPSAYAESNEREILQDLSIVIDGKEREATFARGVWEYMQKYQRSNSGFKALPGLDFYTFEVKTNPYAIQPSGSFNMSKYRKLTLQFSTLQPPLDPNFTNVEAAVPGAPPINIPPGADGNAVCLDVVQKNFQDNKAYGYDLDVYVEKFNMLVITGGMAGLAFVR